MNTVTMKLKVGSSRVETKIWKEGDRIFFNFPFHRPLMAEVKMMAGSKWHGYDENNPRKLWSVSDCSRNHFQLNYLAEKNPYARYDANLDTAGIPTERFHLAKGKTLPLQRHQPAMIAHMVQRRECIVAAEMGTSKTLAAIIASEIASAKFEAQHGSKPVMYYVAPRSALKAVEREFRIWGSWLKPEFMTYEGLVKKMKSWASGTKAPYIVIYDESSRIKNFTSQRSQAAYQLAEGVRNDWAGEGYVILLSGSPAPKSPLDWWSQSEIARPGYLREGDIYKFKNRLAIIVKKEGEAGGVYPELVSWLDSESKCAECGALEDEAVHQIVGSGDVEAMCDTGNFKPHVFKKSVNEIAYLQKRLSGLVIVFFKKDCLDLPDKNYRVIELKPSSSAIRAMKMLLKTSPTVIEGLTRVRELSDGFQYEEIKDGEKPCETCNATGEIMEYEPTEQGSPQSAKIACPTCGGTKKEPRIRRITKSVKCPKDDALRDLLDEHEDIGRIVIYAGFEGSIDRCVQVCQKEGWHVIRVAGGSDRVYDTEGRTIKCDYLTMFQDQLTEYPRVAFVAHPGSAGMGLTLTASPTIVYYSNDFNAESRIQSEDRIHRTGMDLNRGATIIDLVHLDTDRKVLENLKKKRDLQSMTLGEFAVEETHVSDDAYGSESEEGAAGGD